MKRPIVLVIMDGWGIAPNNPGNANAQANTPNFDRLWASYPHTPMHASGTYVGLPANEVGNTETGHLNMGAGHVVYQDLPRINMSIADGTFYKNMALLKAVEHVKQNKSTLHLMGLIGAGGVHANNEHLFALLLFCHEQDCSNVVLHLFGDGRDSPPSAILTYLNAVQKELNRLQFGHIASITGRYYAMDRDERWERTGKVYEALTTGNVPQYTSVEQLVNTNYEQGITDEFIPPSFIVPEGQKASVIQSNDAVIFFNFRIDRPRQLTKTFALDDFDKEIGRSTKSSIFSMFKGKKSSKLFRRGDKLENFLFVTMTEYEKNLPVEIAFPAEIVENPLGAVLSSAGLRQLRLAESEKERFVTFYFNGQREMPFIGEDRIIIPSLQVPTYDLAPHMRTKELANTLVDKLAENVYDCYIVNFAAPDMVGHTGVMKAGIKACEVMDESLGQIDKAVATAGGALLITADHGNCEQMLDPVSNMVNTEHSANPVPFIIVAKEYEGKPVELPESSLANISPTILALMEIPVPTEMNTRPLIPIL